MMSCMPDYLMMFDVVCVLLHLNPSTAKLRPEAGLNSPPSSIWFRHTELTRLKAPFTSVSSKAVLPAPRPSLENALLCQRDTASHQDSTSAAEVRTALVAIGMPESQSMNNVYDLCAETATGDAQSDFVAKKRPRCGYDG